MCDPLKMVQKALDKIYSHLLYFIENEFWRLHGRPSPSVTGIDEAIERIRKTHTGNWGESIELEGDFGDLYSNQCCQPPESLGPARMKLLWA